MRAEYKLGWHNADPVAFLESAKQLPHPAQHEAEDLPKYLCEAVRFAVSKGDHIVRWRENVLTKIDEDGCC